MNKAKKTRRCGICGTDFIPKRVDSKGCCKEHSAALRKRKSRFNLADRDLAWTIDRHPASQRPEVVERTGAQIIIKLPWVRSDDGTFEVHERGVLDVYFEGTEDEHTYSGAYPC